MRAAGGGDSKDEGASSMHWILLRDAALLLLRMRREGYGKALGNTANCLRHIGGIRSKAGRSGSMRSHSWPRDV